MNSVASKLTGLLEGILGPATSLEGNPLTYGGSGKLALDVVLAQQGE